MSHKPLNRYLFFCSLMAMWFFVPMKSASACSCGPTPTVLDSYNKAGVVVIVRAVSLEKVTEPAEVAQNVDGVRSTMMVVERVFKGNVKVGDEMIFAQGGGGDCIWTFNEQSIGKEFLFYLYPSKETPAIWYGGGCGRSASLDHATDDLLYLNNLAKYRGRSRISGTINFTGGTDLSVAQRKIRIRGTSKTYELKTNKSGVYEIYDLPPGKYLIEPEMPTGWKVASFYLRYSPSFAGNGREESPKQIPIVLEAKRHAGLDIHFEIDNLIRGKVFDRNGNPMGGVCLNLLPAEGKGPAYFYEADCTEEDGAFSIEEIPSGNYVLVINKAGKLSSNEPFGTFYYPNVHEREKAVVITIGPGQNIDGLNIQVPEMKETITIDGLFLYSDGQPVVGEFVQFESEETEANIEGNSGAKTDASGQFSIKILKGLKGKLLGGMFAYIGEFENCPKLESIIRKTGQTAVDVKTPAIAIQADTNLFEVELRYPFPGCKKAP